MNAEKAKAYLSALKRYYVSEVGVILASENYSLPYFEKAFGLELLATPTKFFSCTPEHFFRHFWTHYVFALRKLTKDKNVNPILDWDLFFSRYNKCLSEPPDERDLFTLVWRLSRSTLNTGVSL